MTLLQELRAKADRIRTIGAEARAEARALGAPSYYIDANVGDGIVEELPDGSKRLISARTPSEMNNDQAA
jgi:hypothetical protein